MFKRLIVATDLSPASSAVVRCLGGLKAYGAEQCLLLQCLDLQEAASTAFSYQVQKLEELLQEGKNILEKQGFTVETRTVTGVVRQEIVRIAEEENYSLIVVGARGHSLIEDRLLGWLAYGITHNTSKPVLVVPVQKGQDNENVCESMGCYHLDKHVLFATDFSEIADNAFTYLEQLAAHGAKKVSLVHIQEKTKLERHQKARLEEFNEIDQGRLKKLKQRLLAKGAASIDTEICYGVPFVEISRLVRERDVQLVVMGTQGRGFIGEFFLGSVSHNVARYSSVPVLLVPALR
jgi:nucleotide-binding universal stress UspA family protein